MRKFLLSILLIAAVLLSLALVSCDSEVVIATKEAPFSGAIIYGTSDDGAAAEAARAFRERLFELGLADVRGVYAYTVMKADLEIIFGETDREVSRIAAESLRARDEAAPDDFHWEYRYSGGRLVIIANSPAAYEYAIDEFFASYVSDGKISVPSNLSLKRTYTLAEYEAQFYLPKNETFNEATLLDTLPLPALGERYDAGQGSYTYVMKETEVDSFHSLRAELEKIGFKYYTGNTIGRNLYATYLTKTQIVHVTFLFNRNEIRTSVDMRGEGMEGFDIAGLSGDNTYERSGESLMTLVEIENADWPGGLSMIFKLADGRFFIVDSGVGGRDNDGSSSGWIYASLKKHADDPENIVIATWLITHVHSDHAGGLLDIARGWYETSDGVHKVMPVDAADKIKIERIIYNQPADMQKYGRGSWMKEIIEAFDVKSVVKAHPGQQFFIADLTLTVYGSQDLLIENNDTITSHNEHSVVTKIDFNERTLLALADAETKLNSLLAEIYAENLKSDVIQTAHHGYGNTGAKAVNELCNPDIVLWPVATYEMVDANVKTHPINEIFLTKENYAPHGGNLDFDANWSASEPYSVLDLIPVCSCGCGEKSSWRE